ncbi:MAG: hypothetical protein JO371_03345 [Paraburkholderia sp.]|nr:hypothetical protein [Paraburkholderia sp.]
MYDEFIHDACACSKPGEVLSLHLKAKAASPVTIKKRLFFRVAADGVAQMLHILAEAMHRIASGQAQQSGRQRTQREATQPPDTNLACAHATHPSFRISTK